MLEPRNNKEDTTIQTVQTIKQALHHLADELPESATWKDVAYEAYVRQEIEAGLAEVRRGEFAGDKDVNNTFAKWGVQKIKRSD